MYKVNSFLLQNSNRVLPARLKEISWHGIARIWQGKIFVYILLLKY